MNQMSFFLTVILKNPTYVVVLFIFRLTEYPCTNTMIISFLDISRIFLEQKNDMPWIFLEHESIFCRFLDAVNMIHDVIRSAKQFHYTVKFILSLLEIITVN